MKLADNLPGYFAIIPAEVRYDASLPPNAKLLYGEISALASKEGYCFATNAYFSRLYGISQTCVARLLTKLEQAGHIRRIVQRGGRGQVVKRLVYLTNPSPQFLGEGIDNKVKENSTRKNINATRKEEWL